MSIPKIKICLSELEKADLEKIPSETEIKNAVFTFQLYKSPGSDGLHPFFYQKYWGIVSHSIFNFCFRAFKESKIEENINTTHICLIYMCNNAQSLNNFRPISLCNTSYKIITKIMSRRLRPLMDKIIGPCQSSFLKNRQTADNATIIQEVIRHF